MARTLMLVGPSKVGKSATIKELVTRHDYRFVITCTTRAPRSDEADGRDYDFINKEKFQALVASEAFVDWDYCLSNYGGIYRNNFLQHSNRPKVLHVLARMALRIEKQHRNVRAVFLAPEDMSVVYDRIRAAFNDPDTRNARFGHADEEMLHSPMFRKVITVGPSKSISEVAAEIEAWRLTIDGGEEGG